MSSKDIEKQIEQDRRELADTIDELNRDMTPGQLLDKYYLNGKRYGTFGLLNKFREDPIPMALVGSAIAWSAYGDQIKLKANEYSHLMRDKAHDYGHAIKETAGNLKNKVSGSRSHDNDYDPIYSSDPVIEGEYSESQVFRTETDTSGPSAKEKFNNTVDATKAKASSAKTKVASAASSAKNKVTGAASSARGSISSAASSTADSLSRAKDSTVQGFHTATERSSEFLQEHPYANVSIGYSLGVMLASLTPTHAKEDQYMKPVGDKVRSYKDKLVDKSSEKMKETFN